jgi:hypothetical protein
MAWIWSGPLSLIELVIYLQSNNCTELTLRPVDVGNLRLTAKHLDALPALESQVKAAKIRQAIQTLFNSFKPILVEPRIDDAEYSIREINPGWYYCVDEWDVMTRLVFMFTLNKEGDMITIRSYKYKYHMDVRLFETSNRAFFRGRCYITNYESGDGGVARFEIPVGRPLYLHGLAQEIIKGRMTRSEIM